MGYIKIISSLTSALLFDYIIYNLMNFHTKIREFLFLSSLSFILILILYDFNIFIKVILLIGFTIIVFKIIYKPVEKFYIVTIFIAYIIFAICDMASGVIVQAVLGYRYEQIKESVRLTIIIYLVMIFIAVIISTIVKKIWLLIQPNKFKSVKENIIMYIYIMFIPILITVSVNFYEFVPQNEYKKFIVMVFVTYCIYFVLNIYVIDINNRYVKQKYKYKQLKSNYEITEQFIENVRTFRHDYNNIMLSINGFIETNDMDGLKKYFTNEVLEEGKILYKKENTLVVNKIVSPAVKGLMSSKIIKAEKLGLNVNMCIVDDIDEISMKIIDLCKVLGIFLDNAIEAAEESIEKSIDIYVLKDSEGVMFSIVNSFKIEPNINEMFKMGVSTKQGERGIGLSEVKNIIDKKYNNILMNTRIQNNRLQQEMYIYY